MNRDPQSKRIAIVGGGISGLAAAWFLEQRLRSEAKRADIVLYESSEKLGGKINTIERDGRILELGAESFLSRKPFGIRLCRELGIEDQLRGTRPETKRTYVWTRGEMHPLPEGLTGFVPGNLWALRKTRLLPLAGKLRIALDLVLPSGRSDEDESIAGFIRRRLGEQALPADDSAAVVWNLWSRWRATQLAGDVPRATGPGAKAWKPDPRVGQPSARIQVR